MEIYWSLRLRSSVRQTLFEVVRRPEISLLLRPEPESGAAMGDLNAFWGRGISRELELNLGDGFVLKFRAQAPRWLLGNGYST